VTAPDKDLPPPAGLTRRVAEVTHALMEAQITSGGSVPLTAAEICVYDGQALTVAHTVQALHQAHDCGMVAHVGPL
jgi:hypothetical protein